MISGMDITPIIFRRISKNRILIGRENSCERISGGLSGTR